jgi:hypothetical protein
MYSGRTLKSKDTSFGRGRLKNGVRKEIKRRGKTKYILHDGFWVCLSWISVADKPGYDKGRESVAPEEKLWII